MFRIKTPAKINLFLNLRGQRPDGFHEVGMIMQAINLYDELLIEPGYGQPGIELLYSATPLGNALSKEPTDKNLIVKAYEQFFRHTDLPRLDLRVTLTKNIPVQAGLGGGSSDASAMLMALNHLTHSDLTLQKLAIIAAILGSDVPFFLTGGLAYASGRGERVEPLGWIIEDRDWLYSWVIVKPKHFGISTVAAYDLVRKSGNYHTVQPDPVFNSLRKLILANRKRPEHSAQRLKDFESRLLNDFEPVLFPQYPQLEMIAGKLRELGGGRPLLSGSGPSMACLLPMTQTHQKMVAKAFPEYDYEVHWTLPHNGGPFQVESPAVSLSMSRFC